MPQVRKDLAHLLAGLAVGGEGGDAQAGVGGDQPHQFGAGISGGAEDRDVVDLAHRGQSFPTGPPARLRQSRGAINAGKGPQEGCTTHAPRMHSPCGRFQNLPPVRVLMPKSRGAIAAGTGQRERCTIHARRMHSPCT